MKVIGFVFTKISAEKESKPIGDFSLDTNIDFSDIKEEDMGLKTEEKALKTTFNYLINYLSKENKKQKAKIQIEGEIFVLGEEKEGKEILDAWKKKEVPVGFKVPLLNLILKKCTPKAVQMEDELNLPAHIPFPQLRMEKKEEKD